MASEGEKDPVVSEVTRDMSNWEEIANGRDRTEKWALRSLYATVWEAVRFQPGFKLTEAICLEKFKFCEDNYKVKVDATKSWLAARNLNVADNILMAVFAVADNFQYLLSVVTGHDIDLVQAEVIVYWGRIYRSLAEENRPLLLNEVATWPEYMGLR
jgi:hypothetical protein